MTTSKEDEHKFRKEDLGAASYITKPVTFRGLIEAVKSLAGYWVELVALEDESFGSAVTQNPRDKRASA